MKQTDAKILRGAVVGGVINGFINGLIQLLLLWGHAPVPLTVDTITNDEDTVLGAALPLAVTLAMILTVIAYLTLKASKRRFFPSVLWLMIKHGVLA